MSLLGVKRTWVAALQMSAFDPKRTLAGPRYGFFPTCYTATYKWRAGPGDSDMRRRDFIKAIVGSALTCPHLARAQQNGRIRRIAALMPYTATDAQAQARNAAFLQGLQQLGWTVGRNIQIDYRWSASNVDDTRKYASELVALAPDLIFAAGTSAVAPLLQVTRSVPVVFTIVADPVGSGFVNSLSRPGGNATGFMTFEYGIGAKWLEMLKQLMPGLRRVAVIRDPHIVAGIGQWGAIQAVAPSFGVELTPINVNDPAELERAIAAFAEVSNGGMIVTGSSRAVMNRDLIIALAARHKLPATYIERHFVAAGGLICYGPDFVDQYRRAASYVDRILKGEKPADLPVQAPTKYELVVNLKTAKALGLTVPPTLLDRADEVIE
jgi:putative ABC transport system substrate-binding protein